MNKSCNNCHQSFEIFPEDQNFYGRFQVPEPTWCPECRVIRRNIWRNERKLYKRQCDLCLEKFIFFYPEGLPAQAGRPFPVYCRNCSDCFGCVNVRNGKYMMWNEQLPKEEYTQRLEEFFTEGESAFTEAEQKLAEMRNKAIAPSMITYLSKDSSGNWIENAKRATYCFNVKNVEDVRYCQNVFDAKDCMDYSQWGNQSEMIYECASIGIQCANVKFSNECWNQLRDAEYCMNCHNSHDLFGCIGLRNSEYCILNKQYDKASFDELKTRIIARMRDDGEYGEFFPTELSPLAYNESVAMDYFPKTKEQIQAGGYIWRDLAERKFEITPETPACATCGRAFRILDREREFYQRFALPIPLSCHRCRFTARRSQLNPMQWWKRQCAKCSAEIETTFAPDRPEIVYCEQCYQQEVI